MGFLSRPEESNSSPARISNSRSAEASYEGDASVLPIRDVFNLQALVRVEKLEGALCLGRDTYLPWDADLEFPEWAVDCRVGCEAYLTRGEPRPESEHRDAISSLPVTDRANLKATGKDMEI